jgi:4-amino-4-deoxy-L-arabinose transferase
MMNETSKLLLICSFFFLILSLFFSRKNLKTGLLFLFCSSLFIGAAFATFTPYLNLWDEQFHALVAKSMSENPLKPTLYPYAPLDYDYKSWISNHIWLHKPPLSLWQIALSIKLFGTNYFAVRIPSIVMHALLVFPAFSMGKMIWSAKTGYYAALVFSFLNFPLDLVSGYHTSDHVDMAFIFYVTLSIWAWVKYYDSRKSKHLLLVGTFVGLAILTKWLVGLLVFAGIGAVLICDVELRKSLLFWKHLAMSLIVVLALVLPWHIYVYVNFRLEYLHEFQYNTLHFSTVVEGHGGGLWYYWNNLSTLYGSAELLSYLILISFLFVWKTASRLALFLYVVVISVYLFFTLAATKMPAFTAILVPVIILVVCAFVIWILDKIKSKVALWEQLSRLTFMPVIVFLVMSLLGFGKIHGIHFKDHNNDLFDKVHYEARNQLIQSIDFPNKQKAILFLNDEFAVYHEPILWMFYHNDLIAYEGAAMTYNLSSDKLKAYIIYEMTNGRIIQLNIAK